MNALELTKSMPSMLREALDNAPRISLPKVPENILVCGMGGSAIAGDLMRCFDLSCPLLVQRDYSVPEWVNSKTLVFACSYSGNTEETVSMFKEAQRKGAQIIAITTNGKLQLESERVLDRSRIVLVPRGLPPRFALPYFLVNLLSILAQNRLCKVHEQDMREAASALESPSLLKNAQQLAEWVGEKNLMVISSARYEGVCRRWCQQMNENAKRFAFHNVLPEQNHNEILAYRNPLKLHVVVLSDFPQEMQKRLSVTKELIKQSGVSMTELALKGNSRFSKMMTAVYVGDLVSCILAGKYGVDAMETKVIEELKKRL